MFHLDVVKVHRLFRIFQAGEHVTEQPGEQTGQAGE